MRSVLVCALCIIYGFPALAQSPQPGSVSISALPDSLLKPLAVDADGSNTIEGEKAYVEDLAQLLVGRGTDDAYVVAVTRRLSMADRLARPGYRRWIAEQTVAQTFNDLMKAVTPEPGLPLQVSVSTVHQLRTVLEDSFPELTSVESHPSDCLPSEATLLLILLINDGHLVKPSSPVLPQVVGRGRYSDASTLSPFAMLAAYETSHARFDSVLLYDKLTKSLGF